jgi:hypothetical protein
MPSGRRHFYGFPEQLSQCFTGLETINLWIAVIAGDRAPLERPTPYRGFTRINADRVRARPLAADRV